MCTRRARLAAFVSSILFAALFIVGCAGKKVPDTAGPPTPQPPAQRPAFDTPARTAASATMRPATPINTDGIWYNSVPVNGPYIAITFDDGPHASNTPQLLDILAERGVKATFYVVGQNVVQYPGIMQRMAAEGHEIGNHTWDHPSLTKLSLDGVHSQLQRTHDAIVQTTGVRPRTLRPPYGAFNKSLAADSYEKFGYKSILWSVDPMDWKNRYAPTVTSRILDGTRSGSIVLAHDIHKSTIDAMPETIDKLLAAGYRFVTVSQLIAMDNSGPLAIYQPEADVRLADVAPIYMPNAQPYGTVYRAPSRMSVMQYSMNEVTPRFQRVAY